MRTVTMYRHASQLPSGEYTLKQLGVLPLNEDKILRAAESNWKATNPHYRTPAGRSASDDPARVAYLAELQARRNAQ